jgi:hypothetical protein
MASVRPTVEKMVFAEFVDKDLVGYAERIAAFRTFIKAELSEENLDFLLLCRSFREDCGCIDFIEVDKTDKRRQFEFARLLPSALVPALHYINSKFIMQDAECMVNLPSSLARPIREACASNDPTRFTCHMLDSAMNEIQALVTRDSYPRFLRDWEMSDMEADALIELRALRAEEAKLIDIERKKNKENIIQKTKNEKIDQKRSESKSKSKNKSENNIKKVGNEAQRQNDTAEKDKPRAEEEHEALTSLNETYQ